MATITIINTLSAEEKIMTVENREGVEFLNAGAKTGPYPTEYKFNSIALPLPRTNLKVNLLPGGVAGDTSTSADGSFVVLTTSDLIEVEFYKVMKANESIPGLDITVDES